MNRRTFITLLGGAAATWPLAARAQPAAHVSSIGMLMAYAEADQEGQTFIAAFREALATRGWAEGSNIRIEARWARASDAASRQRFAKELVALKPDVILSHGTPSTEAVLQETRTLSIIFLNVSDPIGSGFVTSFPAPGGNVTGFITMEGSMAGKWVELLKDIAPRVTRCALLYNPSTAPYARYFLNSFTAAAASFAVQPIVLAVRDVDELEAAIAAQTREPNGSLVIMPDTFTTIHRAKITALADQYKLPAVYPFRFFAASGGLLSYGSKTVDAYRRAATYADRILKGEKPEKLPVQGPTVFELIINIKTAKALGLDIPPGVLARADEVIE
jgi:putative tryptophan/tyrosine transport system substrate-binding protein